MGVSKDTGPSDLLMKILVRKVRAVDTASDWIIRRLVDQEGVWPPSRESCQQKIPNVRKTNFPVSTHSKQ